MFLSLDSRLSRLFCRRWPHHMTWYLCECCRLSEWVCVCVCVCVLHVQTLMNVTCSTTSASMATVRTSWGTSSAPVHPATDSMLLEATALVGMLSVWRYLLSDTYTVVCLSVCLSVSANIPTHCVNCSTSLLLINSSCIVIVVCHLSTELVY